MSEMLCSLGAIHLICKCISNFVIPQEVTEHVHLDICVGLFQKGVCRVLTFTAFCVEV